MADVTLIEVPLENAGAVFEAVAECAGTTTSRLKRPEDAHMTLLFLGSMDKLTEEISRNSGMPQKHCAQALSRFLDRSLSMSEKRWRAQSSGLRTLHRRDQVWSIMDIVPSAALRSYRQRLWDGYLGLLAELEVDDPKRFVRTSAAMDLPSVTWLPHVTVARSLTISSVDLRLNVRFGAARTHV